MARASDVGCGTANRVDDMTMDNETKKPHRPEIVFGDGGIDDEGNAYIASFSTDPALEDAQCTRMWSYRAGKWLYRDVETIVQSAIRLSKPRPVGYALGRDGLVSEASAEGVREERIADAGTGGGKLGYVNRIRWIGSSLYVCGHAGQVYRRTAQGWIHLDAGVLKPSSTVAGSISLYDIDGASEHDIYVTGLNGILCHYDGAAWSHLDSPTNYHLERLVSVSEKEVYICGGSEDEGLLFVGNRVDGWKMYKVEAAGGFSGLTVFQGTPYVCSQRGLWSLRDGELIPVVPGIEPGIWFNRLVSNADILWSIGHEDLATYDGATWTRVRHLDAE